MTNACDPKRTGRFVRAGAFTLLELLLVMAVLISLAAIVWPNVTGRRRDTQLESMASRIAATLALTRNVAMNTSRRSRCVFDSGGAVMRVEWEANVIDAPGEFTPLKRSWTRVNLIEQGIHCVMVDLVGYDKLLRRRQRELLEQELPDEMYEPIVFYPDGRCDSALIILAGASERQIRLELSGLTGQVSISEHVPSEDEDGRGKEPAP